MNRVDLTGYVGNDPDVRWSQGTPSYCIASYRLAVKRRTKDKEGIYGTDWIQCRAIGKGGEFASKYVKKGMRMEVSGQIRVDISEKEGKRTYYTYVLLDNQEFGQKKDDTQESGFGSQANQPGFDVNDTSDWQNFDDGELPFV